MGMLIISVLNSASDRLTIPSLLSCIFFWSFDLFFHLGHILLSWLTLYSKGESLRYLLGWGIPHHCDAVCGGGIQEGTMPLAQLSVGFQSLSLLPISKLGPSVADCKWVGLCAF